MKAGLLSGFAVLWLLIGSAEAAESESPDLAFCVYKNKSPAEARDEINYFGECTSTKHGRTRRIGYKRNKEITQDHPLVTKAIVAIHPAGSNPDAIYGPISRDIDSSLTDSVWLVAPQLITKCDTPCEADVLRWSDADPSKGWGIGDVSVAPDDTEVSSFEVVDKIIEEIHKRAKNLKEVIVVGFSRGGRFVSRYSAGTTIDNGTRLPGVSFRYIIASQSSYMYLTEDGARYSIDETQNADPGKVLPGVVATNFSNCEQNEANVTQSDYNSYPNGPTILDSGHYMATALNDTNFVKNVAKKKRLFLVGESDIFTGTTGDEAGHCAAEVQGTHRRNRAFNYMQHLRDIGAAANANFCVIKGAAHDAYNLASSYAAEFYWQYGMADCSLNDDRESAARIRK